jgi:hypothetical protein
LKHFLGVFLLLIAVPKPSKACSLAGCAGDGVELRQNFAVLVTHGDKPLPGVMVQVTNFGTQSDGTVVFSEKTGSDGTVHVQGLLPGQYWLKSDLLGIGAGEQCFHIASSASRRAKGMVKYEWGDLAPSTRQVVGRLIDPRPGEGMTMLQNLRNNVVDPIRNARLKLQDPSTSGVYTALSDSDGNFKFGDVSDGTYVLHIEGGATPAGRDYEPTDMLIRVSRTAPRETLLLERTMGGAGSCGGPSIMLEWPIKSL